MLYVDELKRQLRHPQMCEQTWPRLMHTIAFSFVTSLTDIILNFFKVLTFIFMFILQCLPDCKWMFYIVDLDYTFILLKICAIGVMCSMLPLLERTWLPFYHKDPLKNKKPS